MLTNVLALPCNASRKQIRLNISENISKGEERAKCSDISF